MTRCCGQVCVFICLCFFVSESAHLSLKAFGCPYNSAGFVNPTTGGYVPCTIGSSSGNNCQNGFVCLQSSIYESASICCSDTASTAPTPPTTTSKLLISFRLHPHLEYSCKIVVTK